MPLPDPIPTVEPTAMFIADSLAWNKELEDFSAAAWVLTYRVLPQTTGTAITLTAAASGATHQIRLASGATAAFVAADYWMLGSVRSNAGDERFQVYAGPLTIKANPATATTFDGRTYLQRILALLETSITANEAPRNVIRYSYGGVTSEIRTLEDALKARQILLAAIANEAAATLGQQRRILTRFRLPR
jgi:hypothetical protein